MTNNTIKTNKTVNTNGSLPTTKLSLNYNVGEGAQSAYWGGYLVASTRNVQLKSDEVGAPSENRSVKVPYVVTTCDERNGDNGATRITFNIKMGDGLRHGKDGFVQRVIQCIADFPNDVTPDGKKIPSAECIAATEALKSIWQCKPGKRSADRPMNGYVELHDIALAFESKFLTPSAKNALSAAGVTANSMYELRLRVNEFAVYADAPNAAPKAEKDTSSYDMDAFAALTTF